MKTSQLQGWESSGDVWSSASGRKWPGKKRTGVWPCASCVAILARHQLRRSRGKEWEMLCQLHCLLWWTNVPVKISKYLMVNLEKTEEHVSKTVVET